ncbi:MAG: hypothetical protein LBL83_08875, partial [Clostridiales bacterium]|nr:hypothetical protein [Clostridiales bacterium]
IQWLLTFIPKTAKDPAKVLEVMEYINSKAGRDLLCAGPADWLSPEGVSSDGTYTLTVDPATRKAEWGSESATEPLAYIFATHMFGYIPAKDYGTFEEAYANRTTYMEKSMEGDPFNSRDAIQNGQLYSVSDLLSETNLEIDNDVKPKINTIKFEYWDKIIMEPNPENIDALWDEYTSKWRAGGGDAYIQAYQEYYDEINQ